MPKITLLFASLHVLLMLILAVRVVGYRRAQKIGIGDGGDKLLARRVRVHANFIEYVPAALLMLALLELSGLAQHWLWAMGGSLLLARVLHAIGFSRHSGYSLGRFLGTLLTWIVLAAMAVAGLWLSLSV
jgi:uncharacterized protein